MEAYLIYHPFWNPSGVRDDVCTIVIPKKIPQFHDENWDFNSNACPAWKLLRQKNVTREKYWIETNTKQLS